MRYMFQSEHGNIPYKPQFFTEAIKVLIWANGIMFVLKAISQSQIDLAKVFGLSTSTVWPMIWQPVTYMFIHGDVFHVFINMFVLWMFGSELESIWGKTQFLRYYFLTGIGSGLIWLFVNMGSSYAILIGASGAVYGILLAYGIMFPNRTVYLYFLFPIKVKWLVIFLGAIAFFSSFNSYSNISHVTHLSGMIIGYIYLRYFRRRNEISFSFHKQIEEFRNSRRNQKKKHKMNMKHQVDKLLDKINEVGYENLSEEEQNLLYKASQEFSNIRYKN